MIGFGAWNLFGLKPGITHDPLSLNIGNQSAVRLLLKNVLLEIALGTVVILIVGSLSASCDHYSARSSSALLSS
jgi:hypothetical protein